MTGSDLVSTERRALVQWVARLGAVTAEALAAREERTASSARGLLLAAERAGLLARERPLTGVATLYTATRSGLRIAGMRELDPVRVSASNARHAAACAAVAVALERAYPDQRLVGEHQLRAEERRHGAALASASLRGGIGGGALLHRPDLVLWPQRSDGRSPLAVEVELSVKAPRRLREICTAWARCRCVAGVLYVASAEVRTPLERAIAGADAARRILVVGLDDLADRSAA